MRLRRAFLAPLALIALAGAMAAGAMVAGAMAQAVLEGPERNEPILPLPPPAGAATPAVELGRLLFADPRLSRGGKVSCATCHDLESNGASPLARDRGDSGRPMRFNTPTIFNTAYSFRLNWEGKVRSIPDLVAGSIRSADLMGDSMEVALGRLRRDPVIAEAFETSYGRPADADGVVAALSDYVASLSTPDSPFDRWLAGNREAIGRPEKRGYRLFRSFGCASCHQGVNVGANLYQRHGIFHPLASPDPPVLRVPSLRNVAVTAPYFHDGSIATLDAAVRAMARSQLNLAPDDRDVADIVAFLRTLTGNHSHQPLRAPPTP